MDEPSADADTRGMSDPWSPVDPLGEALHLLRMSGVFYCRSEFTAPWALALPPFEACMMFHVVTVGQCWLEVEGANPVTCGPATWRWCRTARAIDWSATRACPQ